MVRINYFSHFVWCFASMCSSKCIFFNSHIFLIHLSLISCREWPNPVLLKQPEDSNLNLPVWDPRVSIKRTLYFVSKPGMSLTISVILFALFSAWYLKEHPKVLKFDKTFTDLILSNIGISCRLFAYESNVLLFRGIFFKFGSFTDTVTC